jgi:cholesterol transport system auxiliary component
VHPARPRHDLVLAVRSFTIDPLYDGRGLKYRKGESEYESDFYHEFLVAPQVLLSSQVRNWLSQSGRFKTVLEPGSLIEPTHLLEGNILVLHGDFRDRSLPQAVIRVRVFLVANKHSGPEVVLTRDYRAARDAEANTADALVTAFDRCLEQILSALEQDLEKVL